jgi:hypothetical protein
MEVQEKLKKDPNDRRAYQESIATYNRLTSLLSKETIEAPSVLRELQARYFRAKEHYKKMLK